MTSRIFAIVVLLAWSSNALAEAQGKTEVERLTEMLSASNDYLELVRKYWPRVGSGDIQAMTVSFAALNNCGNFRSEISAADTIDDLEASLQGQHPQTITFAKGIYFKCKRLVEHYAEFPGWGNLRMQAALAGDIPSRIWLALEYYSYKDSRPREDFPYSPGAFLTEAMAVGHPMVFALIGAFGHHRDILQDKSKASLIAWSLLACKYHGGCDEPESMKYMCIFMTPECVNSENVLDMLRQRAGSDEVHTAAQRLADELYVKVQQKRFEELGLNLVW